MVQDHYEKKLSEATEALRVERRTSQQLRDALAELCDASDVTWEVLANDFAPGEAARRRLRKGSKSARAALAAGVSLPPTEDEK